MPFDVAYLRQKVKDKLKNDPYYDDAMILDAINEEIDDLTMFSQIGQDKVPVAVLAGTREYLLSADFLLVKAAMLDGRELNEVPWENLRQQGIEAQTTPGTPGRFYIRNAITGVYFGLDFIPSVDGSAELVGVLKTVDLVLDTDLIPYSRAFTKSILHGVVARCLENDAATETESDRHYAISLKKRAEASTLMSASSKRTLRLVRRGR